MPLHSLLESYFKFWFLKLWDTCRAQKTHAKSSIFRFVFHLLKKILVWYLNERISKFDLKTWKFEWETNLYIWEILSYCSVLWKSLNLPKTCVIWILVSGTSFLINTFAYQALGTSENCSKVGNLSLSLEIFQASWSCQYKALFVYVLCPEN